MICGRKCEVILIVMLAGFTDCIKVQLSGEWQAGVGWNVNCSWTIPQDDRLQSVRLTSTLQGHEDLFMIYRPETHGLIYNNKFNSRAFQLYVECSQEDRKTYSGQCRIIIEPLLIPNDTQITCEASGERPWFRTDSAVYIAEAFVPSNAATFTSTVRANDSNRVHLNCTAEGIPAPNLVWTKGEEQYKIPSDFTGSHWNATAKFWHVWSTLSYTAQADEQILLACTPEVRKGNRTVRGTPAVYNSANSFKNILPFLVTLLQLASLAR